MKLDNTQPTNYKRLFLIVLSLVFLAYVIFLLIIYRLSTQLSQIEETVKNRVNAEAQIEIERSNRMAIKPTKVAATNPPVVIYEDPTPILTEIKPNKAIIGTRIEIKGKYLNGYEGDLEAWIVNSKREMGLLSGDRDYSTPENISLVLEDKVCQHSTQYSGLPCDSWLELKPGKYKVFVQTWDKRTEELDFTIE